MHSYNYFFIIIIILQYYLFGYIILQPSVTFHTHVISLL